jgi:hypothetical protein
MAKFIKNSSGHLVEDTSVEVSAGAADATKIPHLNAAGVLDATVVNSTVVSAGAASSGQVVALDASGKLDSTIMPVGIGADTMSIVASEAIAAGAFVNIHDDAGVVKLRNADATVAGKHAMGFVLVAAALDTPAVVYFEGTNTGVTGQVAGDVFLDIVPGLATGVPPSASGNVVQVVGFATSATSVNFNASRPVTLL